MMGGKVRKPFVWLLDKERRELAASKSWWVMLLAMGPLVGVSFISAVRTYGEASGLNGTAAGVGEAFSPLVGVWAPTFSACELAAAFLLPFVGIRLVSGDRQSGALKLELQHPMPAFVRLGAKAMVLLSAWIVASLAPLIAVVLWRSYGGAIYLPELATVAAGHLLNAGLTVALAASTAAITEHPSTAAILTLTVTVGTWIVNFIAAVQGGVWERVAGYTPTAMVGEFHRHLRTDVTALRRNLVRPRRQAHDEPCDDGRRCAGGDLRSGRREAASRDRRDLPRTSARRGAERRGRGVLWHMARSGRRGRILRSQETGMKSLIGTLALIPLLAADTKVDLSSGQVGRPPATFEPMVGTWVVTQDGPDKVIMVDGRPWVASKDNPTRLLVQSARRLYGTSNEELMDNAKQFAYFPVAVLKSVDTSSNGTISVKFKTIAGDADRASGILINVKPNGDWLAVRYNDTENNVALWEFHNGIRRNIRFSDRAKKFMLDRNAWHELKLAVDGADLKTWLDGELALEYTLGTTPAADRNGAPPNPDLIPS